MAPSEADLAQLAELGGDLPSEPIPDNEILELLDRVGSPATMASAGPRYFGFVTGGALPVTVATNVLAGAWDQNAKGLNGAPSVRVVAGAEAHVTLLRAVALLGFVRGNIYSPEASRRARGIAIWAALRSLGRAGVADMIERCCVLAARFGARLREDGHEVLNDVVLNQVLVAFGDGETTRRVIKAVQDEGTCWCGGTEWQGRAAMRISVSSWATTATDIDRSAEAIMRAASQTISS